MSTCTKLGAALALASAVTLSATVSASAECTKVGSVGTGINEATAKFMAQAGIKNILDNKGLKPEGQATFKCEAAFMLTECHAAQKGCK